MHEENITTISTESHFKGWPIQLWEAIISNIDAKTLLKYAICQGNAYNVRSFSSIIGETFFSLSRCYMTNEGITQLHQVSLVSYQQYD